jgi:hypothetical protein
LIRLDEGLEGESAAVFDLVSPAASKKAAISNWSVSPPKRWITISPRKGRSTDRRSRSW